MMSGSSISLAKCKSAPHPRQITIPASHHLVFTGQMLFLLPNQQRQRTEGRSNKKTLHTHTHNTHNRFTALLDFVRDYPGEQYQKGKINLDLLEQEIVSGSDICLAICKSAPHPR